jgi:hypothetical protein
VFIPWLLKDGVTTAEVTKMGMCCEMEYRWSGSLLPRKDWGEIRRNFIYQCYKHKSNTLVRKILGKRPFGRPESVWKDNIKMDIRIILREVGRWMKVAQVRVEGTILVLGKLNLRIIHSENRLLHSVAPCYHYK